MTYLPPDTRHPSHICDKKTLLWFLDSANYILFVFSTFNSKLYFHFVAIIWKDSERGNRITWGVAIISVNTRVVH